MKKLFLVFFLILTAPVSLFAEIQLIPKSGMHPKHFIQFDGGFSPRTPIHAPNGFFSAEYNFNFAPFFAMAAIQYDAKIIDATFQNAWAPFAFQIDRGEWRFGVSLTYHRQDYFSICTEHNVLPEAYISFVSKKNFKFLTRIGYSFNSTTFPVIEDFVLYDGQFVIHNEIGKIWGTGIEIFAMLSSYSKFFYPKFWAPQFSAGLAYNITNQFRLSAQVEWGLTKVFESVLYIDHLDTRFGARFSF